jgi:hypothetical protein
MKTSLGKIFNFALLAMALTACGTGNNTSTYSQNGQTCVNGVCTQTGLVGGTSISSGAIGFSGTAAVSQTSIYSGQFPSTSGLGTYGQLTAGSSMASGGALIQFQPKQGTNGSIQMYAGQNSIYGTIQLSPQIVQQISQYYGPNAQVTSLAIWSTHFLQQSSYQSYTGTIAQAIVYLYLNGSYQAIGPLVF